MKIPCTELGTQTSLLRGELLAAVAEVLDSGRFLLGRQLAAFEAEFAAALGAPHAVGAASGTEALQLALMAVGVRPGDEVITQANTCVPTVCAIVAAGARPALADVDPVTLTLDPDGLARALTPRTRAIVPVHLYGHACDMDPILAFAAAHGLKVVEDCAQAAGTLWRGRPCGTLGHAAAFSFYPTKNLGACGDAGAVVTGDASIAADARALRQYGQSESYRSDRHGLNSRLDEVQAAILRVKLKHLGGWVEARRRLADEYRRRLQGSPVTLPAEAPWTRHAYHLYVIRSAARDGLRAHLDRLGIGTLVHYPIPIHRQPAYAGLGWPAGGFPRAERACAEVLSLPLYPELPPEAVGQVADAIRSYEP